MFSAFSHSNGAFSAYQSVEKFFFASLIYATIIIESTGKDRLIIRLSIELLHLKTTV